VLSRNSIFSSENRSSMMASQMIDMGAGRTIGAGHPPFIIATKDARAIATLDDALAAIEFAAQTRCDAIKLGAARQGSIPWSWCPQLFQRAHDRGIVLLARPCDESAVSRLDWLGAVAYDIPFDLSDLDTIAAAARTGKPLVLGAGSATDLELAECVALARRAGRGGLAIVLPTHEIADLGRLDRLAPMAATYGVELGIADSHIDAELALVAIARGACVVEKRRGDRGTISNAIRQVEVARAAAWAHN
jgi:N-acetylneuraminate synthase